MPLVVHSNVPVEMPLTTPAHAHGGSQSTVTRLVLHDEEYNVGPDSAEQIARFFADPSTGTSAHYVVDANSVQHCVPENVVAYHAPPNAGSIGIEHDGFAHYTSADWAQAGSVATLMRSAELAAGICARWGLPVRFLSSADLIADPSARGITFHSQVTQAFGQSDHMDPGLNFPIDAYLANVRVAMAAFDPVLPDPPPLIEGDDVPVIIRATGRPAAKLGPDLKATPLSSAEWSAAYHLNQADPAACRIVKISTEDHDTFTGKGA